MADSDLLTRFQKCNSIGSFEKFRYGFISCTFVGCESVDGGNHCFTFHGRLRREKSAECGQPEGVRETGGTRDGKKMRKHETDKSLKQEYYSV